MKPDRPDGERITELALRLAMVSPERALGLIDLHFKQFEQALLWHRQSCKPVNVARRLTQSMLSRRLSKCLALVAQQKKMLQLATDDERVRSHAPRPVVRILGEQVQCRHGPIAGVCDGCGMVLS